MRQTILLLSARMGPGADWPVLAAAVQIAGVLPPTPWRTLEDLPLYPRSCRFSSERDKGPI